MLSGIARSRMVLVCSVFAAALAACSGGGGGGEEAAGCGQGPLFISDTYKYDAPKAQVGRDYSLAPIEPPVLCNAHYQASALPDGLTINAANGVISGRPTKAQTVSGVVTLTSPSYSGSVTRGISITVDPYPLAPNGWTFMNAQSPLPYKGPTYAAAIGSNLFAFTPTATAGNLQLGVMRSADGGATWSSLPAATQAVTRAANNTFEWLLPATDPQSIYFVSYETTADGFKLVTRRFDGSAWTKNIATQAPSTRGYFSVAMNGGVLYLIGGSVVNWNHALPNELNSWTVLNEIWSSADQGITWQLLSSNPALPSRAGHCAVAADGQLYVYGGFDSTSQRTDLWRSADGMTWTSVGNSGSFVPSSTRKVWLENCVAHGAQVHVPFDSSTWRGALGTQIGHFDLGTGAWSNDGKFPIADDSDSRRFHPGLASSNGLLHLVGGGCGPSSCSVGRDDVWRR